MKSDIFDLVNDRFGLKIDASDIIFVTLKTHKRMEPQHYPRFTMLM